ncbi:MAG: hypothetical protein M1833_003657 [Piccolia ochrophora]|nr:MAG: hypothetical protein M1833_003657 [Piccolia ochrophora]
MPWKRPHATFAFRRHGFIARPSPLLHRRPRDVAPGRGSAQGFIAAKALWTDALPAALVPPVVFCGLLGALWFYKCCMMILFQNKIIYMPGVPLFARRERIVDYERQCRPIVWTEERIITDDGKQIALCVSRKETAGEVNAENPKRARRVVIVYFQGNASSLPPRLPLLSATLRSLGDLGKLTKNDGDRPVHYSVVAVSYRGYWTSEGSPSQKGIERDAGAALRWVSLRYAEDDDDVKVVLWGQSVGAGIATTAAVQSLRIRNRHGALTSGLGKGHDVPGIHGMILETPFTSLRDMLVAIYPQRWLPYRYLGSFLRNWWDSRAALRQLSHVAAEDGSRSPPPTILLLRAEQDELVPHENAAELKSVCEQLGFPVKLVTVRGALHNDVMIRSQGRNAVTEFLSMIGQTQ